MYVFVTYEVIYRLTYTNIALCLCHMENVVPVHAFLTLMARWHSWVWLHQWDTLCWYGESGMTVHAIHGSHWYPGHKRALEY